MKNTIVVLGSFALFCCVKPASSASIVPGRSIGKVHLHSKRHMIIKRLGKPAKTTRHKNGILQDVWFSKNRSDFTNKRHQLLVTYKFRRVIQIEVTSPHFATWNGISTKHHMRASMPSQREIRMMVRKLKSHRKSRATDYISTYSYYDDVRNGITIVTELPSAEYSHLRSIIVHRLNKPVLYRFNMVRISH